jgi:hypothetical protein
LDIAAAAGEAVAREGPGDPGVLYFGKAAGSVIYGLLLLKDYDVFMQQGLIELGGKKRDHVWVEIYFEGEAFVLDAAAARFGEEGGAAGDMLFMPGEEAGAIYGYQQGRHLDWSPGDCDRRIWGAALAILGMEREVDHLLEEIAELNEL